MDEEREERWGEGKREARVSSFSFFFFFFFFFLSLYYIKRLSFSLKFKPFH